jgi:hypothetical protein
MAASILNYNNALTQYGQGNYAGAQQTANVFGPQVSGLFKAPAPSSQPKSSTPPVNTNQNNNSGNSGGGGVQLPNLDDVYNPLMSNLDAMAGTLGQTRDSQFKGIDDRYAGQQKTIGNQLAGLKGQLSTDQTGFNNQLQSAYAQAAKDYDALHQRNLSTYGGQSSAGGAADELLNQAYLTSRTGLQNTGLQGQQAFTNEGLDLDTWGSTQNNQLDTWKQQAHDMIAGVFQQGMNEINNNKAMAQSAKAQAKVDLLNQVVQHQQALQDYDTQLRGQLQAAMAMNGATAGQYDPSQFLSGMNTLSSNIPQQSSALQQMSKMAGLSSPQAQNFVYQLGQPNGTGRANQQQDFLSLAGLS